MASPRNRPPDPLERNGARRSRPPNQRPSSQQSEALHHSDDELFAARVSALIAERRRLLRRGLINRLQHLKAAILSPELNDHHELGEQPLLPLEQHGSDFRTQQLPPSSSLARSSTSSMPRMHSNLYVHSVQGPSKHSAALATNTAGLLRQEPTTERWNYPTTPVSRMHRGLETDAASTSRAEPIQRVLPAVQTSDHEREMPPLRHANSQLMHPNPTVLEGTSAGIASTPTLQPHFSSITQLQTDPALPPSSTVGSNVELESTGGLTDVALSSIESFGSQELRNAGFRREDEHSDASQHSVAAFPMRDWRSRLQSSTNQTAVLGSASTASHKPTLNSPNISLGSAIFEGRASLVSPILGLEAQLFSSFAADMYEPKNGSRGRSGRSLAKQQKVSVTLANDLDSHAAERNPGSVSRSPRNVLNEDMQSNSSSAHLTDAFNSLYQCIPKLSPSETATLSGQQQKSPDVIDVQYSNIFAPSTEVRRSLTLLSTVFFDQELTSLINSNFRLSYVPRDKSLLEAVRISDQISCTLDQPYRNSGALQHTVLSGQESQFLRNLYVEPEHLDTSNTSTSPQWILDLQKYHGKVRIPVSADFQRRTYFNMSEHDERRAPAALWHFDNANSSQHADKVTVSSQTQTHVAYATATDTRRYSSYYSNQGVHSSPGDTSVALNFGFQTRTNYPFRKTYRHTQRSGQVSHETHRTPLEAALSFDALKSAEFSAQSLAPASQDFRFFDALDTGSALRDALRADDETPVFSINEEGKLIARKD